MVARVAVWTWMDDNFFADTKTQGSRKRKQTLKGTSKKDKAPEKVLSLEIGFDVQKPAPKQRDEEIDEDLVDSDADDGFWLI